MVHIWYFIAVLGFVQSECPLGWLHFKEGCYLFSKEYLSWYTAQSSCRAHNARLAEVETKDLSDYLISVAKLLDKSVDYWLGGRDDAIDGTWFWSSSDRVFTYTEWGPGEPNGYRYENCVDMFVGHQWKWNDANCSSSQYYICEKRAVNGECPSGWIHHEESCYLFSSENLNWYLAQGSCRGHDARLAEVTSKAQSDFLIDVAIRSNKNDNYWLGGRDDVKEGSWVWSSTDIAFNYTAWGPGEPNGQSKQNCVDMYHRWQYRWDDNDCMVSHPFVCEKIYHETDEIIG